MRQSAWLSIIIPALNEQATIGPLIHYLWRCDSRGSLSEIIVADGGSVDNTLAEATAAGATGVRCSRSGRAVQMNQGAEVAAGQVLYFLHADSWPPASFIDDIAQVLNQGFSGGCFRLQFDWDHWFLRANAWFTRFNINCVRFGDQSLFITCELFQRISGFDTTLCVMEDQEVVRRLRKLARFTVVDRSITTSARKYRDNGVYRLQAVFGLICVFYYLGVNQSRLVRLYRRFIR